MRCCIRYKLRTHYVIWVNRMNGETIFWLIFFHIDARENSWPNVWRTKCCLHIIRGRLKSWSIYCCQKFVEYYDKIIWLQVACTLPFAKITSYIYDLNVNSLRCGKHPHIRTSRSGWKLDKKSTMYKQVSLIKKTKHVVACTKRKRMPRNNEAIK